MSKIAIEINQGDDCLIWKFSTLRFLIELSPWEREVMDIIAMGGKCSHDYIRKKAGYAPDGELADFLEACEIHGLILRVPDCTDCFYCLTKAETNITLAQYGRWFIDKGHEIKRLRARI